MSLLKILSKNLFKTVPAQTGLLLLATLSMPVVANAGSSQSSKRSTVDVTAKVANPVMMANEKATNYVRIALTGFDPPDSPAMPPVNVAIVIDNSSSMGGSKIKQARQAAIAAMNRLRDQDIVSIVLYNSSVEVLVPATKAVDRAQIKKQIQTIRAGGSTALFAGVSKGAAEVRKFLSDESVNRVILLSDGQANVGPSSPSELARLGTSLVKEGISVSTLGLGLGYNEDLMSDLASSGSGNHIFVEEASDLIAVFNNEFNDMMSVVATDFKIRIRADESVRPVRVLGTDAEIVGQDISIPLAQLYSGQQRYFVLELEVAAAELGQELQLVTVEVSYNNMITEVTDEFKTSVNVSFTDDIAETKQNRDHETYAYCSVQIANERNVRATALRDAGQIQDAKQLLDQNAKELKRVAIECRDNNVTHVLPELEDNINLNRDSAALVEEKNWSRNRKAFRAKQYEVQSQQRSSSPLDYLKGGSSRSK
jgi:Ca-activated chloride channel family protein